MLQFIYGFLKESGIVQLLIFSTAICTIRDFYIQEDYNTINNYEFVDTTLKG